MLVVNHRAEFMFSLVHARYSIDADISGVGWWRVENYPMDELL
jgi:hypothetical protein